MNIGIEDVGFTPRYNAYHCLVCGGEYLTVDLARGVTPLFMTCLRTEGCGGKAVSLMYKEGLQPFGLPLLLEWVKPTKKDLKRIKHQGLLDHFARGGLMRRATDTAPDWVKRLA